MSRPGLAAIITRGGARNASRTPGTVATATAGACSGFMNAAAAGVGEPALTVYALRSNWEQRTFAATAPLCSAVICAVSSGWPGARPSCTTARSGVHLNPLDLPADSRPDTLKRRWLTLHTVITVMLGVTPQPSERQALDRAITATYEAAGITHDPATWSRPAPLLRDLAATLKADSDPAAQQMAARLAPWTTGSYSDLFAGSTTVRPEGHLVVWSLRHLPDELRTIGTMLALDHGLRIRGI